MKIVIVSNNDWDGLWYQRQQFASMYACRGHQVLFINKTLQRLPHMKDFLDRFLKNKSVTIINSNVVPQNVKVKTIYTLPPFKSINFINNHIVKNYLKDSEWSNCDLLITYVPTYTALDVIDVLKPKKWAYINVHNYNADQVISDLLRSEKQVCLNANYLFADSIYNMNRLKNISNNRDVFPSEPGVNTKNYIKAFRGNESQTIKTIGYFGGIGLHLNFDIYNLLAKKYNVVFIGNLNNEEVKPLLSNKIKIIPPVSNSKLPELLQSVDILGLFYNKTDYVNGVIPAKIFECISTLKPVVTTGMDNVRILGNAIYCCNDDNVENTIINLHKTENSEIINKRKQIAMEADWEKRFLQLNKILGINV